MFPSIILFLISGMLATQVRRTGWGFLWGHVFFLAGGIFFAWQLKHGWVGLTPEFVDECLNCFLGSLVGLNLGLRLINHQ